MREGEKRSTPSYWVTPQVKARMGRAKAMNLHLGFCMEPQYRFPTLVTRHKYLNYPMLPSRVCTFRKLTSPARVGN